MLLAQYLSDDRTKIVHENANVKGFGNVNQRDFEILAFYFARDIQQRPTPAPTPTPTPTPEPTEAP